MMQELYYAVRCRGCGCGRYRPAGAHDGVGRIFWPRLPTFGVATRVGEVSSMKPRSALRRRLSDRIRRRPQPLLCVEPQGRTERDLGCGSGGHRPAVAAAAHAGGPHQPTGRCRLLPHSCAWPLLDVRVHPPGCGRLRRWRHVHRASEPGRWLERADQPRLCTARSEHARCRAQSVPRRNVPMARSCSIRRMAPPAIRTSI